MPVAPSAKYSCNTSTGEPFGGAVTYTSGTLVSELGRKSGSTRSSGQSPMLARLGRTICILSSIKARILPASYRVSTPIFGLDSRTLSVSMHRALAGIGPSGVTMLGPPTTASGSRARRRGMPPRSLAIGMAMAAPESGYTI